MCKNFFKILLSKHASFLYVHLRHRLYDAFFDIVVDTRLISA